MVVAVVTTVCAILVMVAIVEVVIEGGGFTSPLLVLKKRDTQMGLEVAAARLSRGRVPRLMSGIFTCCHRDRTGKTRLLSQPVTLY